MHEQILEEYPTANIRLYVIWFEMLFGDSRSRWPKGLFKNDPRVVQFWDANRRLGAWYGHRLYGHTHETHGMMWDTYALYGPNSRWTSEPSHLISWARPVFAGVDRLLSDVKAILKLH